MATPEEMAQSMIANMSEKTGKSLEQWLQLSASQSFEKHGQWLKWLKTEHSVSHGFASLIAHQILSGSKPAPSQDDLVVNQYAGAKEALKPIYEALIDKLKTACPNMEIAPKKSYVSLRHKKQFSLIQPSTKTRVDIGINLRDVEATERLEKSGSFNSMVSHRVRLSAVEDVNDALINWLKQAYEQAK